MKGIYVALIAGVVGCASGMQLPAEARSAENVLHSFGVRGDGAAPYGALIDLQGTIYGTTEYGGKYGEGGVFSMQLGGTKTENNIYSFCSQKKCADGQFPLSGLIDVGGALFGTTFEGGAAGTGTVFSLDLSGNTEQVLHTFGSGGDGTYPHASLINVKGALYGTTKKGGANGGGTVFSLDPGTGAEATVYSFCGAQNCADGQYPVANLINVKGLLYGTTREGGAHGEGTVFSLDPATGTEQVVYSFCSQQACTDGAYPLAGLINVKGVLYGTTIGGGANGHYGTVFSLNPSSGTEQVLYSFCSSANCTDGEFPTAGLTNVNGVLYGATSFGGKANGGELFSLNLGTNATAVVYSFCNQPDCLDGEYPEAGLINENGVLYGTTASGGEFNYGTVFSVTP